MVRNLTKLTQSESDDLIVRMWELDTEREQEFWDKWVLTSRRY
jgi:hypothetical protein